MNRSTIRRGIVAFWALWFAIVLITNLCDGLREFGILPQQWRFASGNVQFMRTVTARYQTPEILTAVFFGGVVLWEGIATALFFRAAITTDSKSNLAGNGVRSAFGAGLGLLAAFVLADEIFIVYDLEGSHLRLFIAQLVSLLFIELAPND